MALNDTLTGSAGPLDGHTGESSHSWAKNSAIGALALSGTGTAYLSDVTGGYAEEFSSYTPAAADCDVWVALAVKSLNQDRDIGILARASLAGTAATAYLPRWHVAADGSNYFFHYRVDDGSFTAIGSNSAAGATVQAGDAPHLRFAFRAGVCRVYREGVLAATFTDTGTPLGVGQVGLISAAAAADTTTTGIHYDRVYGSDPLTAAVAGPSSGATSAESTAFTVTLPFPSVGPTVVNLASSQGGDVFRATSGGSTVTSVSVADGATTATFYLLASSTAGARTITPTIADATFTPTTLAYTASTPTAATAFALAAPSPASGYVANASGSFTVTPDAAVSGTVVVTPTPVTGVTFAPTTLTWTTGQSAAQTFTATPATAGVKTIAITNDGGLTNPASVSYTANARTLALSPSSAVASSTASVTFTGGGTRWGTTAPTFAVSGLAGVSVGAVTVASDTSCTATVTTGSATGTATLTDSTTAATATFTVAAAAVLYRTSLLLSAAAATTPTVAPQVLDAANTLATAAGATATAATATTRADGVLYTAVVSYPTIADGTIAVPVWTADGTTYEDDAPVPFAAPTLDLSRALDAPRNLTAVADAELTVNDALHAAIAGAAGRETVVGTTYTVKTPAGTVLRVFTLNSPTAPTSRT